jgi:hypothetical protein
MPKRLLDDSFLSSPSLAKCSPRAQDAFPRFILLADDFGCFEAFPRVLVAKGWPYRSDVSEADVWTWLEEYVGVGMACLWTEKERRWCYLTGWTGPHGQKVRAEYDPNAPKGTPGRHGSKRRTPVPPADLVAAVVSGERRVHDGKPPGCDRVDADEFLSDSFPALEMGLVNGVFPADALAAAVREIAVKLASAPTKALGLTKRAMNKAFQMSIDEALDYEAHMQEIAGRTADYKEGVAAFLEKRAARFEGQ